MSVFCSIVNLRPASTEKCFRLHYGILGVPEVPRAVVTYSFRFSQMTRDMDVQGEHHRWHYISSQTLSNRLYGDNRRHSDLDPTQPFRSEDYIMLSSRRWLYYSFTCSLTEYIASNSDLTVLLNDLLPQ